MVRQLFQCKGAFHLQLAIYGSLYLRLPQAMNHLAKRKAPKADQLNGVILQRPG